MVETGGPGKARPSPRGPGRPPAPRRARRYHTNLPLRYGTGQDLTEASAVNVSRGGLFISGAEDLKPLQPVVVEINLPGSGKFEVPAEVRHLLSTEKARETGRRAGAGVMFTETPPGFADALQEYLSCLDQRSEVAVMVTDQATEWALNEAGYRVKRATRPDDLTTALTRSRIPIIGVVVREAEAEAYRQALYAAGASTLVVPLENVEEVDKILTFLDERLTAVPATARETRTGPMEVAAPAARPTERSRSSRQITMRMGATWPFVAVASLLMAAMGFGVAFLLFFERSDKVKRRSEQAAAPKAGTRPPARAPKARTSEPRATLPAAGPRAPERGFRAGLARGFRAAATRLMRRAGFVKTDAPALPSLARAFQKSLRSFDGGNLKPSLASMLDLFSLLTDAQNGCARLQERKARWCKKALDKIRKALRGQRKAAEGVDLRALKKELKRAKIRSSDRKKSCEERADSYKTLIPSLKRTLDRFVRRASSVRKRSGPP